jgi:hypothetical protein
VKLVYKPFSIFAGAISKKLGQSAFEALWARVGDGERPPKPTAGARPLARVATAAALEAATMAAAAAVVDQLAARAFHHLVGAWPDKPSE